MKQNKQFMKLAFFFAVFVLTSVISITVKASAERTQPTQRTHAINIVPRLTTVEHPGEVVVEIHVTRLPYADEWGPYGIGWTEFDFDIFFDQTRFEPIHYAPAAPTAQPRVGTDFTTWLDSNGFYVASPSITTRVNPVGTEHMGGTLRFSISIGSQQPVMSDVVMHVRFRVLETARQGTNVEFSWGNNVGGVAGFCPIGGPGSGIFRLTIDGPNSTDFGRVTVNSYLPPITTPGGAVAQTHSVLFNPNGGTLATDGEGRTVADGQSLGANMPADPVRDPWFRFVGWNTAQTGLSSSFDSTTPITTNVTVFAQWELIPEETPPATPPVAPPSTATPPTTPSLAGTRPGQTVQRPTAVLPVQTAVQAGGGVHHAFMVGFPDGTVRPTANVTRAEVATILFRLISDGYRVDVWSQDNQFPDVNINNWFNNAVSTMTNVGIFTGMPDGTFQPNRTITRAEFAVAMARFFNVQPVAGSNFPDTQGHWAAGYINALANTGRITGMPDGRFAPNQSITRAEAAALVTRMLGRELGSASNLLSGMLEWSDNMNTNSWFYMYIQDATNSNVYERGGNGIISWAELVPARNWRVLERSDSNPEDIISGD